MNKTDLEKILTDEIKQLIAEFTGKIQKFMSLHEWVGEIVYPKWIHDSDAAGSISVDFDYLTFKISIDEKIFKRIIDDGKTKDITNILVHELSHVLIDPVYKMAIDSQTNHTMPFLEERREQAVQRITNIILKVLPEELYFQLPKKGV